MKIEHYCEENVEGEGCCCEAEEMTERLDELEEAFNTVDEAESALEQARKALKAAIKKANNTEFSAENSKKLSAYIKEHTYTY